MSVSRVGERHDGHLRANTSLGEEIDEMAEILAKRDRVAGGGCLDPVDGESWTRRDFGSQDCRMTCIRPNEAQATRHGVSVAGFKQILAADRISVPTGVAAVTFWLKGSTDGGGGS